MKVLPGVSHLVERGRTRWRSLRQAREPRIEDLLGRQPVPIDLATVRRSLEGRRVLVTGAGGSIGSEICRQVAELEPALLVLLDHDETHLHDTAATVPVPCEQALVDITDRSAVIEAFNRYRPEVVFHAAAHKHVPVLEHHPIEAAATNVFGTLNVVDGGDRRRGPALRPDLDGQGGAALERHGGLQTDRRTDRAVAGTLRVPPTAPSASGTCSAAGAASSPPSPARSPTVARSRSPTSG